MKNRKQITEFWKNQFYIISKDFLMKFNLEENAVEYLTKIGLPSNTNIFDQALEINFYDQPNIKLQTYQEKDYIIIGDDTGTNICIKPQTGEIFSIDFDGETGLEICFINSTIETFIIFLQIFNAYQKRNRNGNFYQADEIKKMKNDFLKVDKISLEDKNNWWCEFINQVI